MHEDIIKNEYGFFEIKNKPSKKELQEYYAQKYYQEEKGCYESSYDKSEVQYFLNKIEQRYQIFKTISNIEIGNLLDVGSGEGFSLKYFDTTIVLFPFSEARCTEILRIPDISSVA